MCLNVKNIYTNSKYIGRNSLHQMLLTVPCGKCVECVGRKKMDWSIRSYYEAMRCFEQGGSILFDTLTYSEDYLPFAYDHMNGKNYYIHTCFDRESVKKFFKRLRITMERSGYDVKNKLRYFLTSEFGVDENCTHRPHYHLLIYNNTACDALSLSRYISRCWPFGKTDGVKPYDDCASCPVKKYCKGKCLYNSPHYVLNNRVFNSVDPHAIAVFQYVAKYVVKDSYYADLVVKELKNYFDWKYFQYEWWKNYDLKKEYISVYRNMTQFHVESKNFGGFALERYSAEELLKTNTIKFQSVGRSEPYIWPPLPKYYLRRLLYQTFTFRGKRYERLNALGLRWKKHLFELQVNRFAMKVRAAVEYYSNIIGPGSVTSEKIKTIMSKYDSHDVAFYQLGVRGKLKPEYFVGYEEIPSESWKFQHPAEIVDSGTALYGYMHYVDQVHFKKSFISHEYLGEAPYSFHNGTKAIPLDHIEKSDVYDMTFQNEELNYVIDFVQTWLTLIGQKKQKRYEDRKYLKYHYEKNGFLNHSI